MTVVYGRMETIDPVELRRLLREQGKRQVELASVLNIDPTAVSKIFSGVRAISPNEDRAIRSWLGLPPSIDGYAGPLIPIIGKVPAGDLREAIANPIAHIPSPSSDIPPQAFGLIVEGDSMDQVVEDGGTVLIDPNDKSLYPGRYYVVANGDGETTFKRFMLDPARLEPCSSNPIHRSILIGDGTAFSIAGRVIWRASRM